MIFVSKINLNGLAFKAQRVVHKAVTLSPHSIEKSSVTVSYRIAACYPMCTSCYANQPNRVVEESTSDAPAPAQLRFQRSLVRSYTTDDGHTTLGLSATLTLLRTTDPVTTTNGLGSI